MRLLWIDLRVSRVMYRLAVSRLRCFRALLCGRRLRILSVRLLLGSGGGLSLWTLCWVELGRLVTCLQDQEIEN
jgi:hypothetical protein